MQYLQMKSKANQKKKYIYNQTKYYVRTIINDHIRGNQVLLMKESDTVLNINCVLEKCIRT